MIKIKNNQKSSVQNEIVNTYEGKNWLKRLHQMIDKNIGNPSLNNKRLAEGLAISERHLFRKIKLITGQSPQKYLSNYRLEIAKSYLQNGIYRTVKETSAAVGFRNTSYFIRQFDRKFNKKPLQVLREEGWR